MLIIIIYFIEISTTSNVFRDQYQVNLIHDLLKEGKMIFAVVGSAHVVMQEPTLRKMVENLQK